MFKVKSLNKMFVLSILIIFNIITQAYSEGIKEEDMLIEQTQETEKGKSVLNANLPLEPTLPKANKNPQVSEETTDDFFKTSLYTGSATYIYPIEVPPGTNDLMPNLSLNYDSSAAKGRADLVGLGWNLDLSYIQRDVRYTANDVSDDKYLLTLNGATYNLVYISSEDRYHTKVESNLWIKKVTGAPNQKGEYWIVREKDGREYRFGYNTDSENMASTRDYVWRWSIDEIKDTNGNKIFFSYRENPNPNDIGAVYPYQIKYNNEQKRLIDFVLEDVERPDYYIFYEQGSKIQQTRRLKEINVYVDGSLVRRYRLNYSISPNSNRSLLSSIVQYGSDGVSSLPPTVFTYQARDFGFESTPINWSNPGNIRVGDEFNIHSDTFDINRDGLQDYVKSFNGGNWRVSTNNGSGFSTETDWSAPGHWTHHSEAYNYYDTFDINGDGLSDLVDASGSTNWKVYLNNASGFNSYINWVAPEGWISYTGDWFSDVTYYDTFDINGDGLPDFVKKGGSSWTVYLNTGQGFGAAQNWEAFGYYLSEFEIPIQYSPEDCEQNCRSDCENQCEDDCRLSCDSACEDFCDDCEQYCYEGCFNWCIEFASDQYCDRYCIEDYCPEACSNCENDCEDEHCGLAGGDWYQQCEDECKDGCGQQCQEQCQDVYIPYPEKYVYTDTFDINGDGLPDLVRSVSGYNWNVYLNNGAGFDSPINWPAVSASISYSYIQDGWHNLIDGVADINGDGLIDFINFSRGVFLNTGKGFNSSAVNWSVPNSWLQEGYFLTARDKLADINGDGLLDFVKSSGGWNVYLNKMSGIDLLTNITLPTGGSISISYESSTKYDNTGSDNISDLGFVKWCVSSVTKDNGMAGAHNTHSIYTYNYADGAYDYQDKEFRGFGYVKETEPSGNYSENYFYQDDARKGRNYRIENKDSQGNPYSKTEYAWNYQTLFTNPEEIYFTYLSEENSYDYDGSPQNPKVSRIQYPIYDNYGNIQQIVYQGDVDIAGDEKFVYNEYVYNPDLWIVDKLKHTYANASDNSTKVKESWLTYDNGQIGDSPTKGNLTKSEDWLDTGTGNPITTYIYDDYGNQTYITGPENHTTITTYDDVFHTFAVQIENAKNHITTNTYDVATGKILSTIDPNGFTTSYEYDVFKRLIKEIQPYDSSFYPTVVYQYFVDGTSPEGVLISKREVAGQSNTLDTYNFYDGFNRLIQTRNEAEDATKEIVTDTFYNAQGDIDKISIAYLADKLNNYSAPNLSIRCVSYQYDPVKRIIRITNTDGTYKTNNYFHWVTASVNERGKPTDFTYDGYERLVKVQEHNQQELYTTSYDYNTSDKLTKIIDAQGNQTIMEYDSLGRKTMLGDPDMGIWRYGYDKADNLISKTDALNRTTSYEYDELNRIEKKDYPTGIDTVYTYDTGTIGTISRMDDVSGLIRYYYDNKKRLIREERTVNSVTYTTQWSYDALDRVTSIIYPDSELVRFTYNLQGEIETITNFVNNVNYNAQGKVIRKEYANGIITELTYNEDDLRLNRIYASGVQDLTFGYDDCGNTTSIVDTIRSITQTFQYDDLNRLINANGSYGEKIYTYDSIGNIILKDGITFTYGQFAGPHAVTSGTDGSTFSYDANGNMITRTKNGTTQIYEYDTENRFVEVKINGLNKATFTYDGNNDRIKKIIYTGYDNPRDPLEYHSNIKLLPRTEITLYIDSLYEKTGNIPTKHIFLENERIISKTQNNIYFYHSDHIGSSDVITNQNAQQAQLLGYAPYGEVILNEGQNVTDYKFTGKELDETGLYFYGARYYDASIARFTVADSVEPDIDKPQSLNRYAYCLNNPLRYVDPTGEVPVDVVLDAATTFYDIYQLIKNPTKSNWASVGIDIGAMAIPYVSSTMLKGGMKVVSKVNEASSAAKMADKTSEGVKLLNKSNQNIKQGKIVLGHYPDYIDMADTISAKRFNIPQKIWNRMSDAEKWSSNKKFLDRAIKRGNEIILSNPVKNINKAKGYFRKELDYLIEKGYRLSDDGSRMVRQRGLKWR